MAKRNKPLITTSVSPYLKDQAEALVESGDFSSMSDLVSIALAEFIGRYTREHQDRIRKGKNPYYTHKSPIVIDEIIE